MDPLDFYELAKEVGSFSSSFPEALKRTIVGRMYYAIFLMIREELGTSLRSSTVKPMYDSLSQKGAIHSVIVDALKEIERSNHLGHVLYGMHRRRRTADYKLNVTRNWNQEITDSVSDAEELLRNKSRMQTMFSRKSLEIDNLVLIWHSRISTKKLK